MFLRAARSAAFCIVYAMFGILRAMYYTRMGDNGTTTLYGCDQRLSKSSAIAEALGALDEATAFLGMLRVHMKSFTMPGGIKVVEVVEEILGHMFTIQAELAGADKHLARDTVSRLEQSTTVLADAIPIVTHFIVPGGTEASAFADVARTIVRRAERRVVAVAEEKIATPASETLAYLNRLSSFLFVLARYVATQEGVVEYVPLYEQ